MTTSVKPTERGCLQPQASDWESFAWVASHSLMTVFVPSDRTDATQLEQWAHGIIVNSTTATIHWLTVAHALQDEQLSALDGASTAPVLLHGYRIAHRNKWYHPVYAVKRGSIHRDYDMVMLVTDVTDQQPAPTYAAQHNHQMPWTTPCDWQSVPKPFSIVKMAHAHPVVYRKNEPHALTSVEELTRTVAAPGGEVSRVSRKKTKCFADYKSWNGTSGAPVFGLHLDAQSGQPSWRVLGLHQGSLWATEQTQLFVQLNQQDQPVQAVLRDTPPASRRTSAMVTRSQAGRASISSMRSSQGSITSSSGLPAAESGTEEDRMSVAGEQSQQAEEESIGDEQLDVERQVLHLQEQVDRLQQTVGQLQTQVRQLQTESAPSELQPYFRTLWAIYDELRP